MKLKNGKILIAGALIAGVVVISSCKQKVPIPAYEPMLSLKTNSPGYVHRDVSSISPGRAIGGG